jgi:CheY-like chemotaxis protein
MSSADSLELMAHELGYSQTRVAYSGREALLIAARFQPHVVLLEINLLDISGYDVARLLYETSHNRDLRLIAPTASREHAGRELARAAGFERYLLKPVVPADLAALLQMSRPGRIAVPTPPPARNKRSQPGGRKSKTQ